MMNMATPTAPIVHHRSIHLSMRIMMMMSMIITPAAPLLHQHRLLDENLSMRTLHLWIHIVQIWVTLLLQLLRLCGEKVFPFQKIKCQQRKRSCFCENRKLHLLAKVFSKRSFHIQFCTKIQFPWKSRVRTCRRPWTTFPMLKFSWWTPTLKWFFHRTPTKC